EGPGGDEPRLGSTRFVDQRVKWRRIRGDLEFTISIDLVKVPSASVGEAGAQKGLGGRRKPQKSPGRSNPPMTRGWIGAKAGGSPPGAPMSCNDSPANAAMYFSSAARAVWGAARRWVTIQPQLA